MTLLELFCAVDDFWLQFHPVWHRYLLESGTAQRLRPTQLCESEMMTILIRFHESRFHDFKAYYAFVTAHHAAEFPKLVSYERFVQLMRESG